ncbi:amino acid--tRNA ligase-related protein [Micromonospora sp. NPDC093277]|uniref:amino acid--tRNA ligase-related protein n=1 Tax=Micromonospora sp. NPDC093277 TaxID=3364291 RepID=UPI00381F36B9
MDVSHYHHGAWRSAPARSLSIIGAPRFKLIAGLQDPITVLTTLFWGRRRARNAPLPITANSISSPMGPGGDSLPVPVDLFGQKTCLADAIQFALEYVSRFSDTGAWYLKMKQHSPMRTAGFGLGVERWLMWVLNASAIRDRQVAPLLNSVSLQP